MTLFLKFLQIKKKAEKSINSNLLTYCSNFKSYESGTIRLCECSITSIVKGGGCNFGWRKKKNIAICDNRLKVLLGGYGIDKKNLDLLV